MAQTGSRHSIQRAKTKAKQGRVQPAHSPPTRAKAAATVKSARLEARIKPELRALIQRAADLEGRKVSEFVTDALQNAAQQAVADAQVLRLSLADQELFARVLLAPPQPGPTLRRAFARRRELVD